MRINNKILNKIIADLFVEKIDKYQVEYIREHGFTTDELKKWIKYNFVNSFYDFYKNHPLVECLLCSLCEFEMNIKLANNQNLKEELEICDIVGADNKTKAQKHIPQNSLYCSNCPYLSYSKIADFIFGYQCSGYCYYLNRGDFSYSKHTDLLWDLCKECGINEDLDNNE